MVVRCTMQKLQFGKIGEWSNMIQGKEVDATGIKEAIFT